MEGSKNNTSASTEQVKLESDSGYNGKVITAQPIPEDPSVQGPTMGEETEKKKRSNMVGRGEYIYTTKPTSTSAHRTDDRCASCNCGGGEDAECFDVLVGCLLCHCLFGGHGGDGGTCGGCGDCLQECECGDCSPCGGDCGNCDCDIS